MFRPECAGSGMGGTAVRAPRSPLHATSPQEAMPRSSARTPDIVEDRLFQERFWRIERIAWVGFALLIVAAVLGVFGGGGPFSSATTMFGASRIEYPTMARWEAGEEVAIRLAGGSGERRLVLASTFAEAFRVDDLRPPPERVDAVPLGHAYIFTAATDAPLEIRIAVTPRRPGYADYAIGIGNAPSLRLSTFIWP
jgi:hypothetical protein